MHGVRCAPIFLFTRALYLCVCFTIAIYIDVCLMKNMAREPEKRACHAPTVAGGVFLLKILFFGYECYDFKTWGTDGRLQLFSPPCARLFTGFGGILGSMPAGRAFHAVVGCKCLRFVRLYCVFILRIRYL